MGLVTLVGLVSKNGILIVEFANKLQLQGLSKIEAVHQAAMIRLRPILIVCVATIGGHFSLTLITDAGAAASNSIGPVLVGGDVHRDPVHPFRYPVHLHAHCPGPWEIQGELGPKLIRVISQPCCRGGVNPKNLTFFWVNRSLNSSEPPSFPDRLTLACVKPRYS